ncbi:hypothetical protein BH20VER1_BH20VER1_31390 [soil metagenome]
MKEKLTLTIDRDAIRRAKTYAKKEKTSVSELVERQFKQLGEESFADKWQGQFPEPQPDPSDPRLNYLIAKYVRR